MQERCVAPEFSRLQAHEESQSAVYTVSRLSYATSSCCCCAAVRQAAHEQLVPCLDKLRQGQLSRGGQVLHELQKGVLLGRVAHAGQQQLLHQLMVEEGHVQAPEAAVCLICIMRGFKFLHSQRSCLRTRKQASTQIRPLMRCQATSCSPGSSCCSSVQLENDTGTLDQKQACCASKGCREILFVRSDATNVTAEATRF